MNFTLNIGLGILVLLIFGIASIWYQNSIQTAKMDKFITNQEKFQKDWDERQMINNDYNNKTINSISTLLNLTAEQEEQLIDLARNQTLILKQQVSNEDSIIGNLTDHRIIANITRDADNKLLQLNNQTLQAIWQLLTNQTNSSLN